LAVNKMTSSSMPPNRRDRFGTIAGVNVPSRSRGTSISTFAHICQQLLGPLAIAAVAAVAPGGLVLAVAEVAHASPPATPPPASRATNSGSSASARACASTASVVSRR
jgi:hypothetical protein